MAQQCAATLTLPLSSLWSELMPTGSKVSTNLCRITTVASSARLLRKRSSALMTTGGAGIGSVPTSPPSRSLPVPPLLPPAHLKLLQLQHRHLGRERSSRRLLRAGTFPCE
ncbi:unnamed protein product [Leptidea sinapis]|uniref:Uncharacterized protein n=1 Tax=Leptidea sinapis TaxID=189913 RepID=A0A5E4PXL3_9NEOP|nr:unnamed protein product [Leptidea sinapis]